MAKRRVSGRGRSTVALLLLAFVLVSTVVIWRRTAGIQRARELRDLERARGDLLAERARLERDIRDASSRARLVPLAERRLGMHLPSDSEIVYLVRPRDDRPRRTADAP
jgi:cell division protein FtsL